LQKTFCGHDFRVRRETAGPTRARTRSPAWGGPTKARTTQRTCVQCDGPCSGGGYGTCTTPFEAMMTRLPTAAHQRKHAAASPNLIEIIVAESPKAEAASGRYRGAKAHCPAALHPKQQPRQWHGGGLGTRRRSEDLRRLLYALSTLPRRFLYLQDKMCQLLSQSLVVCLERACQ
jgi:hypothetical protein